MIFRQSNGSDAAQTQVGRTEIKRWTWNHVLLVRDGKTVRVYLNHETRPEIEAKAATSVVAGLDQLFFGGRCDNQANWEGRLDEIAVFDRALTQEEIQKLAVQ